MTEPQEELEPLFDYTRVQPCDVVFLDDDDDDDCASLIPSKRRKHSGPAVENVQATREAVVIDDSEDNDDLDWLESPPNVPVNKAKPCENSIIKELRLHKEELLLVTESSKVMMQTVEDFSKRDIKTLKYSDCESPIEKPPKPVVERPKVVISIQDKDDLKQFRIYMDDKFERLFKMYADKVKNKVENLVFCFDGDKIDPLSTPSNLEMEDDDMIEVHVKSS